MHARPALPLPPVTTTRVIGCSFLMTKDEGRTTKDQGRTTKDGECTGGSRPAPTIHHLPSYHLPSDYFPNAIMPSWLKTCGSCSMAHSSFGAWVRLRRRALGLTQSELAEQVGCSSEMIR